MTPPASTSGLRIAVLLKEVPDTFGERALNLTTGLVERATSDPVLDEICERAVELALTLAADHPASEVHAFAMAPENATATIRKALAMGADAAFHVTDPALLGADLTLTAEALAAALRHAGEPYDLIVAGNASTDGIGGLVPAMIAAWLDMPHLSELTALTLDGTTLTGACEDADVRAELPAVVSLTEAFPDGRFPNFKGIMAAKKKPLTTLDLAELGLDAEDFSVARTIMTAVAQRPPKEAGQKLTDDGSAGQAIAEYLFAHKLAAQPS
ncbi:electron transfer flavoprotein [Corynebacterium sp. CMW7794]|uniref:electron transfer flavoprotein subunit beta/FixA family protein n=1 Tax=Corynebacterium TaxID=1716 RepID=UPI0007995192|nr:MULTISPECIES: electron transfer flavoprotein subunit beta/FixA family protein [Corynebacterium]KXI18430.1 electron transfer flavoprotein [Corynebacterium sp. CMW7794]